jgi:transglutaminase-like putative cysteine protease
VAVSVVLLMPKNEYGIEWRKSMELQLGDALFEKEISSYIEVSNRAVTDQAYSIIHNAPQGIEAESEAWKIWGIYIWVVKHIRYVEDPPGNHFQLASEVLNTGLGDCDDFAVLLASLY